MQHGSGKTQGTSEDRGILSYNTLTVCLCSGYRPDSMAEGHFTSCVRKFRVLVSSSVVSAGGMLLYRKGFVEISLVRKLKQRVWMVLKYNRSKATASQGALPSCHSGSTTLTEHLISSQPNLGLENPSAIENLSRTCH